VPRIDRFSSLTRIPGNAIHIASDGDPDHGGLLMPWWRRLFIRTFGAKSG
jgi:hypothetical protein